MPTESIDYKGHTIELWQDEDAQSPGDMGDSGLFIVGWHKDFHVLPPGFAKRKLALKDMPIEWKKTHWQIPVEAYIHSGVRLYLAGECQIDRQWDVSQCAMAFVEKKFCRTRKKAIEKAKWIIADWNAYLSGDVWGYTIVGTDETCGGCYGHDHCLAEAKQIIDYRVNNLVAKPVPIDFQI